MYEQPLLMGVLNVTPDSFSDGGNFLDPARAIEQGLKLIAEGADILDIGGESTRPGAEALSAEEETRRILPVIEGLRGKGALISVDTRNAATMRSVLAHGAGMINDITALQGDPDSLGVVVEAGVPVCLMHMQGEPQTMQDKPFYVDVVEDVLSSLLQQAHACIEAGVKRENIILDPGIGFGKTLEHNLELLKNLDVFAVSGFAVLLGTSRKSFIEKVMGVPVDPAHRLGGSIATVLRGLDAGVRVFRVHDVATTKQAIALWQATRL